jgi:hypothetical protein
LGFDTGELTEIWEIEAARKREEDRQDFERELAGIDIGREARFHSAEFVEDRQRGRSGTSTVSERNRSEYATRLHMLLATNPAYAALHATALGTWRDTEDAADKALRQIEAALGDARTEQQILLKRAPLVNGKRVFQDDDGSVWTEDDIRLPDDVAAGIQWKGDEPTRKEFKDGQTRIDELVRSGDRIRGVQVDVADLGVELNDEKNPPSAERTEEISRLLENYKREIEEHVPKPVANGADVQMPLPSTAPSASSDIPSL